MSTSTYNSPLMLQVMFAVIHMLPLIVYFFLYFTTRRLNMARLPCGYGNSSTIKIAFDVPVPDILPYLAFTQEPPTAIHFSPHQDPLPTSLHPGPSTLSCALAHALDRQVALEIELEELREQGLEESHRYRAVKFDLGLVAFDIVFTKEQMAIHNEWERIRCLIGSNSISSPPSEDSWVLLGG